MRRRPMWVSFLAAVVFILSGSGAAEPAATANTAIVPVGKLEEDVYDWDQRHAAVMAIKDRLRPEIVLIGDSITHFWGGQPNDPKGNRGDQAWKRLFGDRPVLNLGFGWDRTQNVLQRIALGELDALAPQAVVIHIGSNNLVGTKNARENTPAETAQAIELIVQRVQHKCPLAKIVVMAVFPHGERPEHPARAKIRSLNGHLARRLAASPVVFLDITDQLTKSDGTISKDVMPDFLHPGPQGYAIWAAALEPVLR